MKLKRMTYALVIVILVMTIGMGFDCMSKMLTSLDVGLRSSMLIKPYQVLPSKPVVICGSFQMIRLKYSFRY